MLCHDLSYDLPIKNDHFPWLYVGFPEGRSLARISGNWRSFQGTNCGTPFRKAEWPTDAQATALRLAGAGGKRFLVEIQISSYSNDHEMIMGCVVRQIL